MNTRLACLARVLMVFALMIACSGETHEPEAGSPTAQLDEGTTSSPPSPEVQLDAIPSVDIPGMDPILRERFEERTAATTSGSPAERAKAFGRLGQLAHGFELLSVAEAAYRNAATLAPKPFPWIYLLATVHQQRDELENAAEAFEQAAQLKPDDALPYLRLASLQLDLNQLELARSSFERAVELEPNHPAGHLGLARIASVQQRFDAAVEHFETALEQAPAASSIHRDLSLAYQKLGNSEAGEQHADAAGSGRVQIQDPWMEAVRRERTGVGWWLQKGSQALGDRRYPQAISAFQKVIEIDPNHPSAHHHLASALARSGDLHAAFSTFDEAIQISPDDALIRFDYGTHLGTARQLAKAIEQLRHAVRLAPDFREAHHNLGSALARGGSLEEAEAAFSRVLTLDPRHHRARFARSAVLEGLGRKDEAAKALQEIVDAQPDHHPARSRLARLLHENGNDEAAIVQYREIVQRKPTAAAWVNLANLLHWSGKPDEAILAHREALQIEPSQPEAIIGELVTLITLEQCSEARARLDLISKDSTDSTLQKHPELPSLQIRLRDTCPPG